MANNTAADGEGPAFLDTTAYLFLDCWSGDPDRAIFCRINTALGAIASVILPIFMVGGFVGNGLTAYIYLCKLRPLTRQGVYFAVIGISDNCSLFITGFMWMFLAKGLPWISGAKFGYFIVNQSEPACRAMRLCELLFSFTSSTLFLLMVIDRCLSVYFPFRFQVKSGKWALKACLLVTAVGLVATSIIFLPFHWVFAGPLIVCTFSLPGWQHWAFVSGLMLLYNPPTLQFLAILVTNGFLIAKMRHIVSEQAEIRARKEDGNSLNNTIICVILSVILITSSLPVQVFAFGYAFVLISGIPMDAGITQLIFAFNDIGRMLILFNQSINWAVLIWKSAAFRKAFLDTIDCRCYGNRSRK